MNYTGTRGKYAISSSEAIARGIASDGGLFVPESFPALSDSEINALVEMNYCERAKLVLSKYLTDFSASELDDCVKGAYCGTFDDDNPAPLREVDSKTFLLDLWHGPTCAFKDLALQLLPHLLTRSAKRTMSDKDIVILVATSGDTGKAALDGFADVPGVKIIVFYPENGVSAIQKLQMTTQTGNNVSVCAIKGNFDDAQTGVKNIFSDPEMIKTLSDNGLVFSSANSINFGRLVPQIIYYVSAYCDLLKAGKLAPGEKFNVAVPTGNFGNILAAVYAKRMGIPVNKFICASNKNRILTDFIRTGTYDRNREFYLTSSPSMDILISSNLERMLYHLYDGNCAEVAKLMDSLKKEGKYTVSADILAKLQSEFWGGFCDDEAAEKAISKLFNEKNMLCDTHTAVAVDVVEQYRKETGDDTLCVMASTASAYKFAPAVLPAVFKGEMPEDGFQIIEKLSEVTNTPIPAPLAGLDKREVLHKNCVEKSQMAEFILKTLLK